jgi:hypothetical protein
MENELVRKLNTVFMAPIVTEERVVYALVEVRKLMDRRKVPREQLKPVRFFCDWIVHIELDHKKGWQTDIMKFADSVIERGLSWDRLPQQEKEFMIESFSLDSVRQQLIRWLSEQGVSALALGFTSGWYWFIRKYAEVVGDCPLTLRGGQYVKEVTFQIVPGNASATRLDMKWTFTRHDSSAPFKWIMPMHFEKDSFNFGRNGATRIEQFDEQLKELGFPMPWHS